jgi:hypothetical protein
MASTALSSSSSSSCNGLTPHQQQQQQGAVVSLPLSGGFFLLNPDGDLQATQETFQGWLQQQLGLQVRHGSRGKRKRCSGTVADPAAAFAGHTSMHGVKLLLLLL